MKNNKYFITLVTILAFIFGALLFYFIYEINEEKNDDKIQNTLKKDEVNKDEVNKNEYSDYKELVLDKEEEDMLNVLANYSFMNKTNGKFNESLLKESLLNYIELYKEKNILNDVVYEYKIEEDDIEDFISLAGFKNKNIDDIVNPNGSSILYEVTKEKDDYIFKISGHGISSYEVEKIKTEQKANKLIVTYKAKCTEEFGVSKIGTLKITLSYNDDFYIENIESIPDKNEHYCY